MAGIRTNPFDHIEAIGQMEEWNLIRQAPIAAAGLAATKQYASSWRTQVWGSLHDYFQVTNAYVMRKIRLVLLPFWSEEEWQLKVDEEGKVRPPCENLYAPDLYVPLMAFITFALLAGFSSGTKGHFSPEILGAVFSAGMVLLTLEISCIYLLFYIAQTPLPGLLDIAAYSGYKYISAIVNHTVLLVWAESYYPVFCFTASMYALFISKSLKRYTHYNSMAEHFGEVNMVKNTVRYAVALLQFPLLLFLGFY